MVNGFLRVGGFFLNICFNKSLVRKNCFFYPSVCNGLLSEHLRGVFSRRVKFYSVVSTMFMIYQAPDRMTDFMQTKTSQIANRRF